MEDIYIRPLEGLPITVEAITIVDTEGDYNVYVNSNLCKEKQDNAYNHELRHIYLNHFYNHDPVIYNELDAENKEVDISI